MRHLAFLQARLRARACRVRTRACRATAAAARRLALATALAAALAVLLVRCDTGVEGDAEQLVVEAFLQTGRPLPPVTLRRTRPLGGDGAGGAATGAALWIALDGDTVTYVETAPGRYVPLADAPVVAPGARFRLQARWRGRTATAAGQAPPPIALDRLRLAIPDAPIRAVQLDSLRRDSLDIPAEQAFIFAIDATLTWTPPPAAAPDDGAPDDGAPIDSTRWIRTLLDPFDPFQSTLVDFFLQPEAVFREVEAEQQDAPGGGRRWQGVYAVSADSADAPLPRHRLRVALVRGDSAYAAFAASRNDPDRREPVSNVTGGLGIATAVALDTLTVTVDP